MSKTILKKSQSYQSQRPNRLSTVLVSIYGCWETPEEGPVEYERRENVAVRLGECIYVIFVYFDNTTLLHMHRFTLVLLSIAEGHELYNAKHVTSMEISVNTTQNMLLKVKVSIYRMTCYRPCTHSNNNNKYECVCGVDEANDEVETALEDMVCTMQQNEESKFTLQGGLTVVCRSPSRKASVTQLKDAPVSATVAYTILLHSIVTRGKDVWKLTDWERLDIAQKHKGKGSTLFKEKQYHGAAIRYSKAVKYVATAAASGASESPELEEMLKLRTLCLLNLSAAQLQLNLQDCVVANCDRVLQVEPTNVKALYRRAKALLNMKDFEAARLDLKKAKELEPNNQGIADLTKTLDSQERAMYGNALKGMFS